MSQLIILSIDQGTTGTTAIVWDLSSKKKPQILGKHRKEVKPRYPKPGWVEEDLDEIFGSVRSAVLGAFEHGGINPKNIQAIGLTNQRETLCLYEKDTHRALAPAIIWQCKRSLELCQKPYIQIHKKSIREKTGLLIDPYFSATKIPWLLENVPSLRSPKALLGTVDTYLLSRLTQGKVFATDASNSSRTLLYNLEKGNWDPFLVDLFSVPHMDLLPEIRDSAGDFGVTKGLDFLPDGIPIRGVLGDQQGALAGQGCIKPGQGKCTYGTGAFLLNHAGHTCPSPNPGILATVAWQIKGKRSYALEGSSFVSGATIQFLRDQMGWIQTAQESETLAREALGAPEVYMVPALSGLGAPYWVPEARGGFFGLTRGTTKGQMVRAALEGMAFQVVDLLGAMTSPVSMESLRVDGGASQNQLLCQIQSQWLGYSVERPKIVDTTSLGAGLFAAIGLGAREFSDLDGLHQDGGFDVFTPDLTLKEHTKLCLEGWARAVKGIQAFCEL